jgi:NitT/TauT family transport system ATP-binding protein
MDANAPSPTPAYPHTPILSAAGLSFAYPALPVLDRISFSVAAREFVTIVGPSGCGKSTLLRLLAGLIPATSGQVLFDGQPLTHPRRRIGFVFQKANLMPWRTVRDNVRLPLELQGASVAAVTRRAEEMIELVGLAGFADAYPRRLSGGMEQRVAIARALSHNPDVLLLDEPFGALDALTRERMGAELLRIWEARKTTVIMVTHSIPEALLLADRVLVLSPRPGHLRLALDVPLARPRTMDMEYQPDFGALARAIREAIE